MTYVDLPSYYAGIIELLDDCVDASNPLYKLVREGLIRELRKVPPSLVRLPLPAYMHTIKDIDLINYLNRSNYDSTTPTI